jgi:cob(I)alamin adenosyltransferase
VGWYLEDVDALIAKLHRAESIHYQEKKELEEQLEAAQNAITELHETMWTVQDGDGPEFVSSEGLKYLREWFDRTEHLTSNPASGAAGAGTPSASLTEPSIDSAGDRPR